MDTIYLIERSNMDPGSEEIIGWTGDREKAEREVDKMNADAYKEALQRYESGSHPCKPVKSYFENTGPHRVVPVDKLDG